MWCAHPRKPSLKRDGRRDCCPHSLLNSLVKLNLIESQKKLKVHTLEYFYVHALKEPMTLNAFKLIIGIGENVNEDNMDIVAAFPVKVAP